MPRILHIITHQPDELARAVAAAQESATGVEVADVTVPEPDYEKLLEQIFAADSVEVW